MAVTFNSSDLLFILDQIEIAEANAAGTPLIDLLANVTLPFGLRTVDGSLNNLLPGQSEFGAADATFPRLADPVFRTAEGLPADFFGPGSPAIPSSSYSQTSGFVIDSQPRTISNLIVDQTPNNPAAYATAYDPGPDGMLHTADDVLKEGVQLVTDPGLDKIFGTPDDSQVFFFPNVSPDAGLSPPFNEWFTFFGQFFDHGLDLVTKGGNGLIFIPLQPDDPLYVLGSPTNFMIETRATMLPGPDGILGTPDDIHEQQNTTTPFVDQNQTYTSHPSHQVFLRAYERGPDGQPHVTGKLIENRGAGADGQLFTGDDVLSGGMATWAVVKAQARDVLGINLTDADVGNVPLLATDAYGNFISGPHGFPQVVMQTAGTDGSFGTADDGTELVEGNPAAPIDLTHALRTGHQFLIDIAATANPFDPVDGHMLAPDPDNAINAANSPPAAGFYDDELLGAHYIAGDGRANENIGLTAVHSIFHSEHNRLVDQTKAILITAHLTDPAAADATASLALLNAYLDPAHQLTALPDVPVGLDLSDVAAVNAFVASLHLDWNGERLFQAARFGTEMQYQHLVFEEFARTLVPSIDEFLIPNGYDVTIDPSIFAEFAHAVFRLGHSMLPETIDRLTFDFHVVPDPNGPPEQQLGLIGAFLNPLEFVASGPTPAEATGAIVRGLTREVGNSLDEFVTDSVRNNLLGTPLDLAALNIARGRDTGLPTLNEARRTFYSMTSQDQVAGDSSLVPYVSWADYAANLKHPESIVNFIAAYGTHQAITSATTVDEKRAAALLLVLGDGDDTDGVTINGVTYFDRLDFLHSTGAWASTPGADGKLGTFDDVSITGLDAVDLWVGGLAEAIQPFGSMLGPTFQFVFETQLENLQNGDRFYYLDRTAGMHFGIELEMNSFAKLIMANTDVTHLPASVFQTPSWILEVDPTKQFTGLGVDGRADPTYADDQVPAGAPSVLADFNKNVTINGQEFAPLIIRDNPDTIGPDTNYLHYAGNNPVVLGGTAGNDILIAGASDADTVYGDAGNDTLNGGAGDDAVFGGSGDDIIYSGGGTDTLDGGEGNDVIIESHSVAPVDIPNLILAGPGKDFIVTSDDISQIFGGSGDDFMLAGIPILFGQGARNNLPEEGDEGNDWIEEGTQDGAPGDTGAFAQPDPLTFDAVPGNDIFVGGEGFDEMIGEGGDDIFVGSGAQDKMDGMSGFDWTTYKNDLFGVTVDMRLPLFAPAHGLPFAPGVVQPVGQSPDSILDRFAEVEGLSGSKGADILIGDDQTADVIANITARGSVLTNISLIDGLQATLDHFFGFDPVSNNHVTSFGAGNIILGGDGSDLITGNDGDDLIDGDKWLNVRISVHQNIDGTGPEIATYDSMKDLVPFMRDGIYNPGQLVAVREILPGSGGFDTAVYNNPLNDPVTGLPNYIINIDDGGTPSDFSDDIVTVRDVSAKPLDGTDRLTHIERLQFADQAVVLVPGLNHEPGGQLAILDGISNTPDNTPTEGQLLKVSIAGVTDADNAGGTVKNATFVWQQEVGAGTGVFTDIILKPGRIGVGFPTADGSTFTVDPALGLGGVALRVRAVYEDEHGVTEEAFSAPTAPVVAIPVPPPTLPTFVDHTQAAEGPGVHFIRSDLDFILDQIHIAERHAAGESLLDLLPNVRVPFGLRTVSGEFNNVIDFDVPDQTKFGAADTVFPRLTDPVFRTAEGAPAGFFGPGSPAIPSSSYAQTSGFVFDSQPRTIANLIVDQTPKNPAAYANAYDPGPDGVLNFGAPGNDDVLKEGVRIVTSPGLDGKFGTADDTPVFFFPNVAPDAGTSASFDAWFTFFGQFFDHGLDLVTKGGNGTIFVPLQPDDPLYVPGSPTNFMVETRATMLPGPDGKLGTADDIHENSNTTTPFVDQNQTYTSHPSHQVFLRAYAIGSDGQPHATGKLIENRDLGADGHFGTADDSPIGGMATWQVLKAQARDLLGINLTDQDFDNVPLLATDPYGNYIRGPNGLPQVVVQTAGVDGIFGTADDGTTLVEGNRATPIDLTHAVRTGHQFLIDVAHNAVPVVNAAGVLQPDADADVGNPQPTDAFGNNTTYDDELLNAHYIAGDGRVNENIGLTAVHAIFHSEHNRLVDQVKQTILIAESDTPGYIKDWVMPGFVFTPGMTADQVDWNGERLFQVAKFGTEMQYQHLVFEEFARTVQPLVDPFFAPTQVYDTKIDPAIVAEFAHTVYRFGHSMLTETVDRFDPNFNVVSDPRTADPNDQLGLIAAFLNPLAYASSGATSAEATGAIVRGVTRTVGNEIDEFVTEALRNNLLGTPLDLAVLNLARGRDTGIPSLNGARAQFYADISDPELKPYTSWADFAQHIKHPESLVNFIAAYGTHAAITSQTAFEGKRAAALLLVLGDGNDADGVTINGVTYSDRFDFLNSTGDWANNAGTHPKDVDGATTTGLGTVDFWIGGLAEEITPFGGLLGSTFNFVFENQMEKLQDADRFYYLERTAGMNFNAELEANSFAKLVEANTDAVHLPARIFDAANFTLEVDPTKQYNADVVLPGPDGILGTADDVSAPRSDPVSTGPFATLIPLVDRDNPYTVGPDTNYLEFKGTDPNVHVVLGGSSGNDILIAGAGNDTVYGDDGNDRLEGGTGNDHIFGGAGDDIITDKGGDDVIEGQDGNDVIQAGGGANILLGGFGQDFIIAGEDVSEVFGGPGNDFLFGTKGDEFSFGNEGDDWIERGTSDGAAGDNFDPFGNEPVKGNDIFKGDGGPDNVDGEGGDDIYIATPSESDRFIGFGGFDWATFQDDAVGVTVGLDSSLRFFDQPQVPGSPSSIISRMDLVEGLSGSHHDDFLFGDDSDATAIAAAGIPPAGSILLNPSLINGLQDFLNDFLGTPATPVVSSFGAGNIILGGEGSDIIAGQGGDDLIDGDAWLNVFVSVRSALDPSIELTRTDTIADLIPAMLAGAYNPGQLQIVRELDYSPKPDFDTAVFRGLLANYTFTVQGLTVDAAGLSAATAAAGPDAIITVTDTSAAGIPDGTDTLRHIERLQFSDQAIVLNNLDHQPAGALQISDPNPTEDELLTVSIADVTDADNVSQTNPTGAIIGTVSYFWQGELSPGVFQDIMYFGAGETQRAVGTSFTPTEPFVGGINFASLTGVRLRVRAVYQDGNGVLEQVFSDPTAPVANVNDPPVGTVALSDVTPTATQLITATPVINDADGMTTSVFSYQWQQSATGAVNSWTDIAGAEGPVFAPTNAQAGQHLRVEVTYVDDHGTTEHVFSEATQPVGAALAGTGAADTITGTTGNDIINGLGGSDTLNGLAGNDTIDGGTGNDTINGGAGDDLLIGGAGLDVITGDVGNDTITGGTGNDIINAGAGDDLINYTMGDGADTIIGDTGVDTLQIVGTAAGDTLDVIYNGSVLIGIEGGTLSGVETVTADLSGSNTTLSYGVGTTTGATVNLATHAASGFVSIAGISNVTGGSGADLLTGDETGNILSGGAGNDTLVGGLGLDTLIGGSGVDTVSYLGETDAMFVDLAAGTAELGSAGNSVEDVLSTIENVVGGTGSDSITGNTAANLLDGGAGAGNDTLLGGSGNDTLLGGDGNDSLVGGVGNDSVNGGAGDDVITYNFGDGTDVLVDGSSGTDVLNIGGTAASNTLSVTWNGSAITALTGIQAIAGIETLNADLQGGTDTLIYAGAVSGISVDLATNHASGFVSITGVENVTGGSGDDTLAGGSGANALAGGAGNDTYVVGAGDTVAENAGAGTDTVNSAVSFTLGTNVENLNLTVLATINGTGNNAANVIVDLGGGNNVLSGQNGTDTLDGGAGKDTLDGGGGNDVIIGGADDDSMTGGGNGDTFVFAHGFGHDVITDFDANGNGTLASQDLIDLTTYGSSGGDPNITALNFSTHVAIAAAAGNTTVTIDGNTILLQGVGGGGNNAITITDFLLFH